MLRKRLKNLPYGRQEITESDIESVLRVLQSDFITQGPVVERFESGIAEYCEAEHALAVNSATSALHLACLALDVGPGDLVWTSPNTFVASANCARLCGADVDFVDVDPQTYNLCAEKLEDKLALASASGKALPKVVIPVHFAGQSCDMKSIRRLADEYGFRIIEDASHAIGGQYLDAPIGNCAYSDITVLSFHPVKIITTGEGGMALSNQLHLYQRMKLLRTHGVQKHAANSVESDEPWRYQQSILGLNYRLTDIQAALGLSQLKRLDDYVARRHELAERYNTQLSPMGLTIPHQFKDSYSALHLYPVLVDDPTGAVRRQLYHAMIAQGIGVNVHYIPVHTQPYYQERGHRVGDYPNAESYYARTLTLPLFGSMSDEEQDRVVEALYECLDVKKAA